MFRVYFILPSLLLMLIMGFAVFPIRKSDHAVYEALLKSSTGAKDGDPIASHHNREKVCKRIWYQGSDPLYFRIDSEQSTLCFFHQNHQIEVIEKLCQVACLMQEELYYVDAQPMQRIRYLEAEKASYCFKTHRFTAEDVQLWEYKIKGHEIPLSLQGLPTEMSATAKNVEFSIVGTQLNFIANRLRAQIKSEGMR